MPRRKSGGITARIALFLVAGVWACDNAEVLNLPTPEPQLATAPAQCFGRNATIFPGNPGAGTIVDDGAGRLTITGTPGNDVIVGGTLDDVIDGQGGADRICSMEGDDQITGGGDPDQMDGGDGSDVILYTGSPVGVTVIMATGRGTGGDADRDRFLNVENVIGSAFGDIIRGDALPNEIQGGGGADILRGGDGADILRGGVDDDVLQGENDDDFLYGDAGADHLIGGEGADALDGGSETDLASYVASSLGVQVTIGVVGAGGAAEGDTYAGIENVTGSAFDDVLTGDTGDNVLAGHAGIDVIYGGEGNDRLRGGVGADTLYGGPGDDLIQADAGNDVLYGEDGADRLFGYDGDDFIYGGAGNDDLRPMLGLNTADGGPDTDHIDTVTCTDIITNVETFATVNCETAFDASNSTLSANAASIVANGTDSTTITLQLRNTDGTPLTLGNSEVIMSTSTGLLWDGTSAAASVEAVAGNNGKYTAILISSVSFETATISATVNGNPVTATAVVKFMGVLDHFAVTAPDGGPVPNAGNGTPFAVKIVALDVDENPASFNGTVDLAYEGTASGSIGVSASFTAGELSSQSVTIPADGTFQITATRTGGTETGSSSSFDVTSPFILLTPDSTFVLTGNSIQLTAVVKNFDGTDAADQTVTWGTADGSIATVDGSGNVTGVAPGYTNITVTQGAFTSSAQLGVCPNLAVGGVYTTTFPAAADICFDGGASGQEYTYMPINLSTSSALSLTVTGFGIQGVTGPPNPSVVAEAASSNTLGIRHDLVDDALHLKMLEANAQLTSTATAPIRTAEKRSIAFGSGPAGSAQVSLSWPSTAVVGDLWPVNVGTVCSGTPDTRIGRVISVGTNVIIVSDTTNPAGGFTTAQYDSIALEFDSIAYPVVTSNFGTPSDIDGNGKIVMFFTRAVNELSPPASSVVTNAYFARRDLYPTADCSQSNEGEALFMLVPDPTGSVNSNVRTVSFVRGSVISTAGHELQHLVNSSRRLHVTGSTNFEATWLDEQLSSIAEELMFYRTSVGLTPRSNIIVTDLTTGPNASRRVAAYNTYANPNFGRLRSWLQRPDTSGAFKSNNSSSLSLRGVGWAFLRYSADRVNGTETSFWASLVDSNLEGKANLQNAIGADPDTWYRDFVAAMYGDDAVTGLAAEITNPSWSYRSLFQALNGSYQLVPRPLSNGTGLTLSYSLGGGTAYTRFGVAAGSVARTTTLSGGAIPASPFALIVMRTK